MDDTLKRIKEVLQRDHDPENKLDSISEIVASFNICYAYQAGAKCIKREMDKDKCGDKPCKQPSSKE